MKHLDFIRQLFEYDHWANCEALASLSTVSGDAEKPRKFFSHVIGAQRVWLVWFETPEPSLVDAWPMLTIDEGRIAVEEVHQRCLAVLDRLTPEKLDENLKYRNRKGAEYQTPIRDVLMHLITHSVYHRGQVAAAVREAGGKPAVTDYMVYLRKMKK